MNLCLVGFDALFENCACFNKKNALFHGSWEAEEPGVGGALCTGVVVRLRGETPLVRLQGFRATPERPGGRQLSESGAAVLHGLPWLHRCGAEPAAAAPSQADRQIEKPVQGVTPWK